jgi:hypothetical protein
MLPIRSLRLRSFDTATLNRLSGSIGEIFYDNDLKTLRITNGAGQAASVVNVAAADRLLNGKLKSTTHRVVNPPREKWGSSRFSIPFFLHPRSEMRLDCLASCVPAGEKPMWEPISAGEFLDERLAEIGLKK